MGNCVALNFSCDGTVNGIIRCLRGKGYIRNLKKNLRALEMEMENLKAIQQDVQNKVIIEEEAGDRIMLEIVRVWLTHVESIDTRFKDLVSVSPIQLQNLCFFGKCSKNGRLSYTYGKSVYLLLEDVKKIKSEDNFEDVSGLAPRSVVDERPIGNTIGQENMLETAWDRLMEDGVGIMGLHGMGGVGKTTLFKKIHNKFNEMENRFDIVIWVVVSRGREISKLQDDIAQKLHLCGERWTSKNESDKAAEMHKVLKKKRFVLMLDDIWEKVDLEAIGVPFPTRENGCKVTFTTRSREICGRMRDHEPMQVKCLEKDEAWELFKNIVGDNTLRRDPNIVEQARKVVEKCRGLPLALNVIGETMSSKATIQEWEHALDVLTSSAAEFFDMENKILPILKFSYDSLVDEHIQSCFLYCALFPEDYQIEKEKLIDYWICEGFMGEYEVLKRAKNKGYAVLGSLIRANLLIEVNIDRIVMHHEVNTNRVVMHDVVREMALWIASDFGKQKETFVVQANVGLHEVPIVKDCGVVRRMSLMHNSIEEIRCCSKFPQLTTLFLQRNKLLYLSVDFIQWMQNLLVLDLSRNRYFNVLPEHISELTSLHYLDLSHTSIMHLPNGLQELKKLTQLNLTSTKRLQSIKGISKLSSLKMLKLLFSNVHGDVRSVKELQLLEQLQFLNLTISTELGLHMISGDQRLANCIGFVNICGVERAQLDISLLMSMKNLCTLSVERSHVWEITTKSLQDSTVSCFNYLSQVTIVDCGNIKDLTWLLFAPNIVSLHIGYAQEVEAIINKKKATEFTNITPFQKLEYMSLRYLPKLESIYWNPLPFPVLKKMELQCSKLRKLPLDAKSVQRVDELKIVMYTEEYKTELEWEDEDTKNRFLPLITQGHLLRNWIHHR